MVKEMNHIEALIVLAHCVQLEKQGLTLTVRERQAELQAQQIVAEVFEQIMTRQVVT